RVALGLEEVPAQQDPAGEDHGVVLRLVDKVAGHLGVDGDIVGEVVPEGEARLVELVATETDRLGERPVGLGRPRPLAERVAAVVDQWRRPCGDRQEQDSQDERANASHLKGSFLAAPGAARIIGGPGPQACAESPGSSRGTTATASVTRRCGGCPRASRTAA